MNDSRLQFTKTEKTDIWIVVEGNEFYLNKNILVKKSSFFESMFSRDWRENSLSNAGQPIYLSELDADICRTIFHFIYTGKLVLPEDEDEDIPILKWYTALMDVAQYFDILEDLELGMSRFIRKFITKHSVYRIWEFSFLAGSEMLCKECEKYLIDNFMAASQVVEFVFSSRELLKRILNNGEIDCSPDFILEKLIYWAKFNLYRQNPLLIQNELSEKLYLMDLLPPQTLFSKNMKRAILTAEIRH